MKVLFKIVLYIVIIVSVISLKNNNTSTKKKKVPKTGIQTTEKKIENSNSIKISKKAKKFQISNLKHQLPQLNQSLNLLNQNEEKFAENTENQKTNKQDNIIYISSFIFIPFVILVLIMTILSIGGIFLIFFNTDKEKEKSETRAAIIQAYKLQKLKNQQKIQKNIEKRLNEPEPESLFIPSL